MPQRSIKKQYPDLALPEQTHYPIGKYGDLHLSYLKVHKKATYVTLLTTCKLNEHLHEVDEQWDSIRLSLRQE